MKNTTIYKYRGKTASGENVQGQFSGEIDELRDKLRSQGVFLIDIKEIFKKQKSGKFREQDFMESIEQLYHLLLSGMRLDKSLKVLIGSMTKKSAHTFWSQVFSQVKQGELLSQAIEKTARDNDGWQVSRLYCQIISVGEKVGELPSALKRLLAHLEFRKSLKSELISSLSYPIFLLCMSMLAIGIVVAVIVPRFAAVFKPEELDSLPLISRVVFSFGSIGGEKGQILLLIFLAGIALLLLNKRLVVPMLSRLFLRLLYTFPVTRRPLLHLDLADVYTAFGSMLEGGVGLHHSLGQSAKIARLPALKYLLETTAIGVKEGQSIFSCWQTSNLVPREDVSLIAVGESSASLGEICLKLGERHMQQFKIKIKSIMALFEPALIMGVGVAIGFLVTGILLAVLSMTDAVGF